MHCMAAAAPLPFSAYGRITMGYAGIWNLASGPWLTTFTPGHRNHSRPVLPSFTSHAFCSSKDCTVATVATVDKTFKRCQSFVFSMFHNSEATW